MSIALSSVSAFASAVAVCRTVDFAAYALHAGVTREALLEAARSGARVRVRLERDPLDDPSGGLHAATGAAIAELRAAGADAALTAPGEPVLHMKAAVVDGVAWLDDRNWTGGTHETVLRDTGLADVAIVSDALRGVGEGEGDLGTTKSAALGREIDLLRAAGASPLALETESFGGGGVYSELLERARAGLPTRLIVAGREAGQIGPAGDAERRQLAKLESLGMAVRTGNARGTDLNEKLAVTAAAAWVGSANATYAGGAAGGQRDWGMATRQPELVDGLRSAFEANWTVALPFSSQESQGGLATK